jgi:hypothetical protein
MKTTPRILLALAACAAAVVMARAADPGTPEAAASPAPTQASVWMVGHWNSEAGQWKWVAGHWENPPSPSAAWAEGHWVPSNGGWTWVNGTWNVGRSEQASSPPMPPSPGEQANPPSGSQAVPMVSSPAPYVSGQYVPNGQVPVVTDYGPIDYSADGYYPGYYYGGSPWFWGGYPGYYGFGLGIGPVFFGGRGFGHGGFGRGGFVGHGGGHFGGGHFGGHGGGGGHFGH